jgi:hypothetical protein
VSPLVAQAVTTATGDWTISGWIYTPLLQTVTASLQNMVGSVTLATVASTGVGWRYFEITALGVGAAAQLRPVFTATGGAVSDQFAIDGIQLENKAYATTYCDGDQEGCRWLGQSHLSHSSRPYTSRLGGRERTFASLGIRIRSIQGAGIPPLTNISEQFAIREGADYQRTTVGPRVVTMAGVVSASDVDGFHDLRQLLVGLMMKGRSGGDPLLLRYQSTARKIQLRVRYEAGLELGDSSAFNEFFALRLIAHDPEWEALCDESAMLPGWADGPHNKPLAMWKRNEGWVGMGILSTDSITSIDTVYAHPNGTIYVAGTFSTIGGVSAANIAYYDGYSWNAMGNGVGAGTVVSMDWDGGDGVYIGGSFVAVAGGVNRAKFAYWKNGAWATAPIVALTTENVLCVKTEMTQLEPVNGPRVTSLRVWAGLAVFPYLICSDSSYANITGTNNRTNNAVRAIAFGPDGCMYLGGDFTTASSNTNTVNASRVAKFTFNTIPGVAAMAPSSEVTTPGATGIVRSLAFNKKGLLLAAGDFSGFLSSTNLVTAFMVASWDGNTWHALSEQPGSGRKGLADAAANGALGPSALQVAVSPYDDFAYFVHLCTEAGSSINVVAFQVISGGPAVESMNNVARWDGTDFSGIDMAFVYNASASGQYSYIKSIAITADGNIIAGATLANDEFKYGPPVTVQADAETPVRFRISNLTANYGQVVALRNLTNERDVKFSYIPNQIFNNVDVDCRPGRQGVKFNDNADGAAFLTPDSALASLVLDPGENRLSAFTPALSAVNGSGGIPASNTTEVVAFWRPRYSSFDAAAS